MYFLSKGTVAIFNSHKKAEKFSVFVIGEF